MRELIALMVNCTAYIFHNSPKLLCKGHTTAQTIHARFFVIDFSESATSGVPVVGQRFGLAEAAITIIEHNAQSAFPEICYKSLQATTGLLKVRSRVYLE